MSNNSDDSVDGSAEGSQDAGSDKSFVGKIVSGLISNTPLSKWFGAKDSPAAVRRREEYGDEEEDDSYSLQPPLKRVKRPTLSEIYGGSPMYSSPPAPISSHPSNNLATGMDLEYNHFPRPLAGLTGANNRKVLRPTAASTITSASVPHLEDEVTPAAVLNGETNTDESDEGSTRGSTPVPVESRTERGQQERSPSEASTEPNPFSVTKSLFSSSRASYHRSLFSESGITPRTNRNHNTSLSSRRPVFDAATFSSPKFVDRTLMTEKILKSPFYQGQTTYGGASAYSTNRLTRSASAEKRHAIQIVPVKPKSVSENASLSKTARRIMNSLEEMNTPITDAKKIPVATREERQEGILSRYIGAKPFMLRDGSKRRAASNRELQVPTVPDLIRMKQKQRLQTSTETVRHIATSSKSTLNDSYALPKKRPSEDDDDSNTSRKHTGKTRSSVSLSTRQRAHLQADDTPVEVNLPNVALPITQLPQFDFRPIGGSSSKEKDNEATAVTEVAPAATSGTSSASIASVGTSYSFSKPIVICEAPAAKPLQAINCFRFSQPVSKKPQATPITTTSSFPYSEGGDSTTAAATSRVKSNGENVGGKSPLPAGRSNAGFGDAFKMKGDQWECGACMLRNKTADNACVACSTARPSSGPASTTAGTTPASKQPIANMFGASFKPAASTWECGTCLIRNADSLSRCQACETPRGGAAAAAAAASSTAKSAPTGMPLIFNSAGLNKFKPASTADTWECGTCMVRNKNGVDKCVACETLRATPPAPKGSSAPEPPKNSLLDKFKATSSSGATWECPSCMVRNKSDVLKCPCCETPKPGSATTAAKPLAKSVHPGPPLFNFGINADSSWKCNTCQFLNKAGDAPKCGKCDRPKSGAGGGFGDAFKPKTDQWKCSSCLVQNQNGDNSCVCCSAPKPGKSLDGNTASKLVGNAKPVISFNFGIDKSGGAATLPFTFGIPAATAATTSTTKTSESTFSKSGSVSAIPAATPSSTFVSAAAAVATSSTAATTSGAAATIKPLFAFGVSSTSSGSTVSSTISSSMVVTSAATSSSISLNRNPLLKPNEVLPTAAGCFPGLANPSTASAAPATSTSNGAPAAVAAPFTFNFKPASSSPPRQTTMTAEANKSSGDSAVSSSTGPTPNVAAAAKFTFAPKPHAPSPSNLFAAPPVAAPPTQAATAASLWQSGAAAAATAAPAIAATSAVPIFKFDPTKSAAAVTPVVAQVAATAPAAQQQQPMFKFGASAIGSSTDSSPKRPFPTDAPASNGVVTSEVAKRPMFSFGAKTGAAAPPAFAVPPAPAQNALSTASSAGYNFAAAATATPIAGGFNFSSGTKSDGAVSNSAAPILFGAPGAKNGPTFNFGSATNNNNNNAQKAVFSFGAGQTAATPTGQQPAPAPTFGAPQAQPQPGGFSFGAATTKPIVPGSSTFNFTGTTPSFNFTDGNTGSQPQRKMRKALRRTQR